MDREKEYVRIMSDLRVLLARYELDHIGQTYHYTMKSSDYCPCQLCRESKALLKELEGINVQVS